MSAGLLHRSPHLDMLTRYCVGTVYR